MQGRGMEYEGSAGVEVLSARYGLCLQTIILRISKKDRRLLQAQGSTLLQKAISQLRSSGSQLLQPIDPIPQ